MKKTLLLSLGFLLGLWTFCRAQNPIVPPYDNLLTGYFPSYYDQDLGITSPQAWSFMKYRGDTPDLYTGTMSVSIPIYTYQDQDFTLPISLNYASNGYIPNVQAGDVGLGWALDAGGYITRTIRGVPDEGYGTHSGIKGFAHLNEEDCTNINFIPNESDIVYIDGSYSERAMPVHNGTSRSVEMEPDIYHFNFMGHTGSFMRAGRKIYVFDSNHPHGEYSIIVPVFGQDIVIKTGNGYTYTFTTVDNGIGASNIKIYNLNGVLLSSPTINYGGYYPELWVLSKITAPNGREVVFTYEAGVLNTTTNIRPGGNNSKTVVTGPNGVDATSTVDYNFIEYTSKVAQIQYITIDGGVRIDFNYAPRSMKERFQIGTASADLPHVLDRLSEIVVTKRSPDSYSSRIQLKKCQLTHVYAGNTAGNPVMFLEQVDISGEGVYKMAYHGLSEKFPYHGMLNVDHWGYNCGIPVYGFANTSNYFFPNRGQIGWYLDWIDLQQLNWRRPDANYAKLGILTRLTYPTGGYSSFEYEGHTYRNYLDKDKSSRYVPSLRTASKDFNAGGLRIKKITDNPINGPATTREYVYEMSPGVSSGILLEHPYYYSEKKVQPYNFIGDQAVASYIYYSTSTLSTGELSGYRTDRSHIEYERVKEVYKDGSYAVYNYANYRIAPDEFRSSDLNDVFPNKYYTPWTTDGEMNMSQSEQRIFFSDPNFAPRYRGKLLTTTFYDSEGGKVKELVNEYDTSKSLKWIQSWVPTVAGFYPHRSYVESYPLKRTIVRDYYGEGVGFNAPIITNTYSYQYNKLGQLVGTRYLQSDGTITNERTVYVSDIAPASQTDVQSEMIVRNVLNFPLKKYSTIVQDQEAGDPDKPLPELEFRTSEDVYEYTIVSDSIICLQAHKVAEVTEPQGLGVTPTYYTETVCDKYNVNGRVLQITDRNGLKTCYVWGYNGHYIVAKVVGVDHTKVKDAIGTVDYLVGALTEAQDTALRGIKGALVTTYGYDPFVGVTKIKDPSGRVKSFTYDGYGRLSGEFDDNGSRMRTYSYSIATK